VGGILLVALATRVFYAAGLPMTNDEVEHLRVARQISLHPGDFNLPLDSPISGHPLGVVYLTALADWVGGGSLLGIRVALVALHLFGLIGVYCLGFALFGPRTAIVALGLAAVDRSLVALSPVFLESPTVIALAPWAILQMHRCATRGSRRDWLLAGVLFGAGHWISTVFLAMLLPFGLYLLVTGRLGRALTSPWMYAGVAVMLVIMLPNLAVDLLSGGSNYERNVDKVGSIGVSPRMAILYVGDLLICLKDPTWIVENIGRGMYPPIYIPCNWVMGLVYMGLFAASVRYWRDERIALLLSVIVGFLIPVTLIDAREPWNEFTWAGSTVVATVLLAAFVLGRMLASTDSGGAEGWESHRECPRAPVGRPEPTGNAGLNKIGKVAAMLVGGWSVGALVWFLAGPKWGYFCPQWERFYVGQVLATEARAKWNPSRFPLEGAMAEIQKLTDEAIARHPESVIAWYFRGYYCQDPGQRREALEQALRLDPNNSRVIAELAHDLIETGDWDTARRLLEPLVARGVRSVEVFGMLAEMDLRTGSYASSVRYAHELAALRPEDCDPYRLLFLNYDAMGNPADAESALSIYVARHPLGSAAAYLALSNEFWRLDQPEKARTFLDRAIQEGPRQADCHSGIAFLLLSQLNDSERAIEHFKAATRMGSTNPLVYYNLGLDMEKKQEPAKAVDYYRRAIQLDQQFGMAHGRLAIVLANLNRDDEARHHQEAAERLGVQLPEPPPQ
jgi:tetratricopeptide (TPR) repeat protein